MKLIVKSISLLLVLGFSVTLNSCKQETKDKVEAAGEAVVEETQAAAENAGEAVTEAAEDVKDALVAGTNYNATGNVPCQMGGAPTGNCDFGVVREGNGNGHVTITKPDGSKRTIFFEEGKATGYDSSQADNQEFKAAKESDMYVIHIGEERYEIPEAVIFGG